jgi:AcrR family transcriptional regulator
VQRSTRRASAQTREHVLGTADELFYWNGIRAIGVDRIAAEAGIAPTQLYRLFASKDDLIAAYVQRADRLYREWFTRAIESGGEDPRARILALFDALEEQVRPEICRGCPFLMALSEVPGAKQPAHVLAVETKRWVRAQFGAVVDALVPGAPRKSREILADQLALIMEGVYASVQALGNEGPAARARSLVETLLATAGRSADRRPARR